MLIQALLHSVSQITLTDTQRESPPLAGMAVPVPLCNGCNGCGLPEDRQDHDKHHQSKEEEDEDLLPPFKDVGAQGNLVAEVQQLQLTAAEAQTQCIQHFHALHELATAYSTRCLPVAGAH